ncbi:MAG: UDP-N-acetylmuramoyl-L-alanine--D-glutamate ligase [Candidatus Sumerlaeaceae bacterium]|nr:UDP-N-acetylmuramoyl-L-alanine--D-glutamate ligase [Candidatus Sumerlaeaceae bacterium]
MKTAEIPNNRFVVFGSGRSGLAAAKLLKRHGASVAVADEKPVDPNSPAAVELAEADILLFSGESSSKAFEGRDVIVLSPGIPRYHPRVGRALSGGLRVIGEIELASAFVPEDSRVIAITGTNGKTTTTAWISHLLTQAGFDAPAVGNIGASWSESVDQPRTDPGNTIFVVETSSFQLESVEDLHPNIALLTNLAPDHLDRYSNYGEYVAAKKHILRNLTPDDAFLWNSDNTDSRTFFSTANTRTFCFSASGDTGMPGAFMSGDILCVRDENEVATELLGSDDLPLPGQHNLENALATALAATLAGAPIEAIREGLRTFRGVEHRIEFCGEKNGVRYYNDSKATNIDSLEKALKSFRAPVILIAGGRHKGTSYDVLKELVGERVKRVLAIGEAAQLMEESWSAVTSVVRARNMEDAVRQACATSESGDVVLLSPACSSYDMYNNYEERGRDFKARVQAVL